MRHIPGSGWISLLLGAAVCLLTEGLGIADDRVIDTFERQQLTDMYFSEGLGVGDLNHDGHPDVVYGPYWFAGPKFQEKHEIYEPKPQNTEAWADHFFAWVYDFNNDGWGDILTAGFPGTPGFVYENPKGSSGHWTKHEVFPAVCNESPQFLTIIGDDQPELICTYDGYFGYATFDRDRPFETWKFHPVSDKVAPVPFGHGLGIGDVNGDRRVDILMQSGWFEQPKKLDAGNWVFRAAPFAPIGGADMYAYDVDGDGDNDVITSLAAHDFGLAWYEQVKEGDKTEFRQHLIMGDQPEQNRYGLVFSEPHSVRLEDIDGDGLKDIITGKTYYSHHKQSPMWDAGEVVYWFRLVRGPERVDWVPYQADDEAGIGRQLRVEDLNGDGLLDIAAGGMKGAHVLIHHREKVSEERWKMFQPKLYKAPARREARGPVPNFNSTTGRVDGAIEGESLPILTVSSGRTEIQKMEGFRTGHWSGDEQLLWIGAKPGDRLEMEFEAPLEGEFEVLTALTLARDYGISQFALDGEPLGEPLDLYHYPEVLSSGEVKLGSRKLKAGKHKLTIEVTGANASALKGYLVGLDYLRLNPR